MAEIRLGRIKFVWQGDWQQNKEYFRDDLVKYGGNAYVCVAGHISATFSVDRTTSWNIIADGQEWKGDWQVSTEYALNDIVKYGGNLYICNTDHTSSSNAADGLPNDIAYWTPYGESFSWKGDWDVLTIYKPNDIVRYNKNLYLAKQQHTSTAVLTDGLESDIAYWEIYSTSLNWTGNWQNDYRYIVNDLVKYGGKIYICITGHTSVTDDSTAPSELGLESDIANWQIFHEGVDFKGTWQPGTRYKNNDLVKYGGGVWICVEYHTSEAAFVTTANKWEQFIDGLEFEDSWSHEVQYQPGDTVTFGGYQYVAKVLNINNKPTTSPTIWDLYSTGFRYRGDWGDDSAAVEYLVGDVVSVGSYTYVCILDHVNNRPPNTTYWQRLNTGIYWKGAWTDATLYDQGDAVSKNNNSYICVQGHVSDELVEFNAPDQTTGAGVGDQYWNALAIGPENNVLTTDGDLLYYSGAGPARLPIGEIGQSLVVDSNKQFPEWKYIGSLNHVFFVERESGQDLPAPLQGKVLNQPWKTIRYSLEQIDKGPMYPDSTYLLENNRAFIQNAVVVWVDAQITAGTGIWNGFVNSNIPYCRRDIGLILDAIIYDLRHGGNEKIRLATLSYFSNGSLITEIADENEQLVAALQQMLVIIDNVISNVDYVDANNTLVQYKDTAYVKEPDTQTKIDNLLLILTNALTLESISNLPIEYKPNNTLFVKTGKFYETLPMIVPQNTAVVGDELRSSTILPADSLIDTSDVGYSLDALSHMATIIPNIITNTSITPTTGNTESQYTLGVAGAQGTTSAITSFNANANEIIDILQNGLTAVDAISWTNPGVDSNRLYARELLQVNRSFIIAELTSWINTQVAGNIAPFTSSFTYDSTACERDVGYIIDAISYDVQYNAEWASVIMARSYYEYASSSLSANEVAPTGAAYAQLATIVSSIVTENYAGQTTTGTPATATEATYVSDLVGIIETVILDGNLNNLPAITYPDYTFANNDLQSVANLILPQIENIQAETVSYIKIQNPLLNFNNTTCYRDAGYMIDALVYDMVLGTNYQSLIAGLSYFRATTSAQYVLSQQLQESIIAVKYINAKLNSLGNAGPGLRAVELVNTIISTINFKLNNTGTYPIKLGSNEPITETDYTYGIEAIEKNRNFIVAEISAYIDDTYNATVEVTSGTNLQTNTTETADWIVVNAPVKFSVSLDAIVVGQTYYIHSITDNRNFSIKANRSDTTALTWQADVGTSIMTLAYDETFCYRDVNAYIDAIKYDLIYAGNYKSISAAEYYNVAVTGSKLENMFFMHNSSGLRNCSLNGLDGRSDGNTIDTNISGLSTADQYGTSRPLAGAYVSLDPGWNPQDKKTWITARSPYVQNVSTFGTGCTGLKVDGELHAGGNDSVVANDFTQILSDGIGFWVTNLGRSELVSVFTYYCHIGYLAENGGKVRATNGNNSYGDYGSISLGVDITEVPITGEVNNRAFTATVERVIAAGKIIALEYSNAGVNYTPAGTTLTVTGDGYGSLINSPVTVNGGVYYVRMLDLDDSSGKFGGEGYYFATNSAQTGTTTNITLSNTEVGLASQLIGLGIYITAGTGAGQYGKIVNYSQSSKLASIALVNRTAEVEYTTVNPVLYGTTPDSMFSLSIPNTDIIATAYESSTGGRFLLGQIDGSSVSYDPSDVTALGNAIGIKLAYDTTANKLIALYTDAGNSNQGTVVTASISGTTASGLSSGVVFGSYSKVNLHYHPEQDQTLIFYIDILDTNRGKYVVGTENGSGLTLGTPVVFANANVVQHMASVYDPDNNRIILGYEYNGDAYNQISTDVGVLNDLTMNDIVYDPNTDRVIYAYRSQASPNNIDLLIGSLSQSITTSNGAIDNTVNISYGSATANGTNNCSDPKMVFDIGNDRLVLFYIDSSVAINLTVQVLQLNPASNTFTTVGTPVSITSTRIQSNYSAIYDPVSDKIIVSYQYHPNSGMTTSHYKVGTVDPINNTISFGNELSNSAFLHLENLHSLDKFGGTIGTNFYFLELVNNELSFGPANAIGFSPWGYQYDSYNECLIFAGSNVVKAATVNDDDTLNVYASTSSLILTNSYGYGWSAIQYDPFAKRTLIALRDSNDTDKGKILILKSSLTTASGVSVQSSFTFNNSADYLAGAAYLTSVNKVVFSYKNAIGLATGAAATVNVNPAHVISKTRFQTAELSSNTLTFGTPTDIEEEFKYPEGIYNTVNDETVFSYQSGNRLKFVVLTNDGTNVTKTNEINSKIVSTKGSIAYNSLANKIGVLSNSVDNLNNKTGKYYYLSSNGNSQYSLSNPVDYINPLDEDPSNLGNIFYNSNRDYFGLSAIDYNTNVLQVTLLSTITYGWNHMITGYPIESVLDGTTTYNLEPLITFSDSDTYPNDYSKAAKGRAIINNEQIVSITIFNPGEGYTAPPTVTISDPNNLSEAPTLARIGDGVLTQPTWTNRGFEYTTVGIDVAGDGYADWYQPGTLITVKNLSDIPIAGSNVVFGHLPNTVYKLVTVRQLIGTGVNADEAPFTAQLQVSPEIAIIDAPEHEESFTLRFRYSQVRLTGHDFLSIGTGNFTNTNYPGIPLKDINADNETVEIDGGRVFYTSTDQDGNFRVGDLFSVEQSTGVATLNADAFNVSGLQELSLGELGLGSQGATITEFSTDGTFTANSDNIVPTQKAIKTYITSQIGGGSSTLNVNSITAGQIIITGSEVNTISGNQIIFKQKVYYTEGIDGVPAALNYFLKN